MLASDLADTVVVLDLDDTLYAEEAYVRSGIAAVCALAAELHGADHAPELLKQRDAGRRDWLTALCGLLPAAPGTRDCLLWAYRLHRPRISLSSGVRGVVDTLVEKARAVAILTDGRSITQRCKLRALGLDDLPVYISDEYGGADKPDPARFLAVMNDFAAARYVYVADNPAKDFVAPKALGWLTIGVRSGADGVHDQAGSFPATHTPDVWIDDVQHLIDGER